MASLMPAKMLQNETMNNYWYESNASETSRKDEVEGACLMKVKGFDMKMYLAISREKETSRRWLHGDIVVIIEVGILEDSSSSWFMQKDEKSSSSSHNFGIKFRIIRLRVKEYISVKEDYLLRFVRRSYIRIEVSNKHRLIKRSYYW